MEGDHDGACDQKTHEVSDHQATKENQEEGAWAALRPLEGLEESNEGDEIGGKTQSGKDGWEVFWGDWGRIIEWRVVDGVADRGVVGERRGREIHGG